MRWSVKHGDILDEPADVLICSANPWLNLSGGVGGEFLLRHGPRMQEELHHHLAARSLRAVPQGEVVPCGPCGTPYKAVLHAVVVDCFYGSSPEVVRGVVSKARSTTWQPLAWIAPGCRQCPSTPSSVTPASSRASARTHILSSEKSGPW